MYAIDAKNLTYRYFEKGKRTILEEANFHLHKGSITVLVGKSGCGKSTLASILAGLLPEHGGVLSQGNVYVDNLDIHTLTKSDRAAYVSMMFQNCDLQFCMSHLYDELIFCLENIKMQKEFMKSHIDQVVAQTKCESILFQPFQMLSGGQKQRAALCCVIALGSKTLILDEPFANLDSESSRELIELLGELNSTLGLTILAIDHHPKRWAPIANELVILEDKGQISNRGLFNTLLSQYEKTLPLSPIKLNSNVQKPLLKITAKVNQIAYQDLTFNEGSMTAILGPSGCGKTTLLKSIMGLLKYEGSIQFNELEVQKMKSKFIFKEIGIVFQNPSNQFITQSVKEEILASLRIWNKKEATAWYEQMTLKLLREFHLDRYQNYSPYMLSQGGQRRLAVLSMIASGQKLLLLDEPTYGQDLDSTTAMMNLLYQQAKVRNLTIIFTTHDTELAATFATHQIFYKDGRFCG